MYYSDILMYGLVIRLVASVAVGAIPVVYGGVKGQSGLGVGGFFACVVSGMALGLLIAVPVCGIFVWQIARASPGAHARIPRRGDWASGGPGSPADPTLIRGPAGQLSVHVNGVPRICLSPVPGGSCVIGRAEGASLRLDDRGVSGLHVRLDVSGPGQAVVTDLASSNGTFVNGVRVSGPTAISVRDVVQVGASSIQIA